MCASNNISEVLYFIISKHKCTYHFHSSECFNFWLPSLISPFLFHVFSPDHTSYLPGVLMFYHMIIINQLGQSNYLFKELLIFFVSCYLGFNSATFRFAPNPFLSVSFLEVKTKFILLASVVQRTYAV